MRRRCWNSGLLKIVYRRACRTSLDFSFETIPGGVRGGSCPISATVQCPPVVVVGASSMRSSGIHVVGVEGWGGGGVWLRCCCCWERRTALARLVRSR